MGPAISGGGWASAYTGTAAMRALDSRLEAAVKQRTGGLLQCITYMSGLSGGGFPTVSFAVDNFPTADEIVDIWQPAINRFGVNTTTEYAASITDMFEDIHAKVEAGSSCWDCKSVWQGLGLSVHYWLQRRIERHSFEYR
jgi:lysophospholipase